MARAIDEMPGTSGAIAFSPDGGRFAAASSDATARVCKRDGRLVTGPA
jgi:hypothetical protein